jgi:type IV secretory pathway VirB3-like protein
MIRGLAPQPRLLWAIAIGAALIALAVASPLLGFVAVVYHVGLVLVLSRDLAMLPARSGFNVHRLVPEPF